MIALTFTFNTPLILEKCPFIHNKTFETVNHNILFKTIPVSKSLMSVSSNSIDISKFCFQKLETEIVYPLVYTMKELER